LYYTPQREGRAEGRVVRLARVGRGKRKEGESTPPITINVDMRLTLCMLYV
jgi:hypothetical protein